MCDFLNIFFNKTLYVLRRYVGCQVESGNILFQIMEYIVIKHQRKYQITVEIL